MTWDFFANNWAELLLGLLAFVKIVVRLTPTINDSRTPVAATVPPILTNGESTSRLPARTAVSRGTVDAPSASGPAASRAEGPWRMDEGLMAVVGWLRLSRR